MDKLQSVLLKRYSIGSIQISKVNLNITLKKIEESLKKEQIG